MLKHAHTILTMSSEMVTVQVDPRELPADSFTESDIARIELVSAIESAATALGQYAQTVGEDLAQAGDYARRAKTLHPLDSVLRQAVIAERVRGASWETIAEALRMNAPDAEARWGHAVEQWRRETPATSPYRKNPGRAAASADKYITTDTPYQFSTATRRPLSASLDAAAHLTGRDVTAADHAFAGTGGRLAASARG
ncbi:hypothetical protein M878_00025 [Streptomyces roseochromogenus subsp. oscitans DS 12.976]|uniref:Uncharacterized protein n=2 Tax=Streptomyces roseochromogenus TaxID=285450 RepID=V6JD86_STRRC|nr:hypothetical protein M878_46320 [Streptomyces roseochromogenus subsp. oscitans DS 12.976]EST18158.1 hypothetical protein M878_45645 [Streptomyces roseochromogenus subsp. oscitans DS 12.976]EST36864.1 hypothetical protein M878_00025 [Streptomyces roseochromogenus subsp. oscitans DS 12.976]